MSGANRGETFRLALRFVRFSSQTPFSFRVIVLAFHHDYVKISRVGLRKARNMDG